MIINNVEEWTLTKFNKEFNSRCLAWRRKNRGHFEIIASMLEAMQDNCTTLYSIAKHTGINYAHLKKYLDSLSEMGFIETDVKDDRVLYRASEKGLDFLGQYYVLLGKMLSTHEYGNMVLPKRMKVREF